MLKFPCFETNARFDHGMSGGPVLDDQGHVCGIIGTGLSPEVEGVEHYSHASTLWPVMGTMVSFPWEDRYPRGTSFPLYEFAKAGFIDTRHLGHVSVSVNPDGIQVPAPCTCIGCPTVHACCEVDEVDQRSCISRLPQLADRLTAGNWRFPSSRPSCDQVMAWFTTPRCLPFRPRFLDTFPHPTSP